jgi:hypothetical protein
MDVGSLASALVAACVGQMQLAAAAKIAKMQADNSDAVAKLVEAADQNTAQLSAVVEGLGQAVDISA